MRLPGKEIKQPPHSLSVGQRMRHETACKAIKLSVTHILLAMHV